MVGQTQSAQTLLDYSISPDRALAGATQNFTFTAKNPETGAPISFTAGPRGDEIILTIPAPPAASGGAALSDTVDFAVDSQTDGFIAGSAPGDPNAFAIKPLTDITLPPGGTIEVTLQAVPVNTTSGTATLAIQEYIGSSDAKSSVEIEKEKPEISITGWLSDATVGKDQPVTLFWQSVGGTQVFLTGISAGEGTLRFPVEGQGPPYLGKYSFIPDRPGSNVITLEVRTSDGSKSATDTVSVTVRSPYLANFTSDPATGTTVAADANVTLNWNVLYARSVALTTPSGAGPTFVSASPLRNVTMSPGADVLAGAPSLDAIPAQAEYLLTGTGFHPQIEARIAFTVAPVKLQYFKYQNRDAQGVLSGLTWATDPFGWSGFTETSAQINTFQLFQPGGGSQTYYLGADDKTHPQIMYFSAQPPKDGKVALTWVTQNLKSLVLDPGGQQIPENQIASGTLEIAVPADNIVMLTGANDAGTVPSVLKLAAATS